MAFTHSIIFASSLNKNEVKYAQIGKETLAIQFAVANDMIPLRFTKQHPNLRH